MKKLTVYNENHMKIIECNSKFQWHVTNNKMNYRSYYNKQYKNGNFINIITITIDDFNKYKYLFKFQFNSNYQEILLSDLPNSFKNK